MSIKSEAARTKMLNQLGRVRGQVKAGKWGTADGQLGTAFDEVHDVLDEVRHEPLLTRKTRLEELLNFQTGAGYNIRRKMANATNTKVDAAIAIIKAEPLYKPPVEEPPVEEPPVEPPPNDTPTFVGRNPTDFALNQSAPGAITVKLDPTGKQTVMYFTVKDTDVAPVTPTDNPRAELQTKGLYEPPDKFWLGASFMFPLDFPKWNGWMTLASVYGAPGTIAAPWHIGCDGTNVVWEHPDGTKEWKVPLVRGHWYKLEHSHEMGTAAHLETYLDNVKVFDGTANTWAAQNNQGLNNVKIDQYRMKGMFSVGTMLWTGLWLGPTRNSVKQLPPADPTTPPPPPPPVEEGAPQGFKLLYADKFPSWGSPFVGGSDNQASAISAVNGDRAHIHLTGERYEFSMYKSAGSNSSPWKPGDSYIFDGHFQYESDIRLGGAGHHTTIFQFLKGIGSSGGGSPTQSLEIGDYGAGPGLYLANRGSYTKIASTVPGRPYALRTFVSASTSAGRYEVALDGNVIASGTGVTAQGAESIAKFGLYGGPGTITWWDIAMYVPA